MIDYLLSFSYMPSFLIGLLGLLAGYFINNIVTKKKE